MKNGLEGVLTIAVAIVGVATLATIVGKNSKTADVIKAAGGAFAGVIKAAVSPVS